MSTFWITNPDNIYRDNVAAGSDANGFWMSLPEHPNGQFEGTEISKATWPRRTPFREFKGNVAHSNYDGFMFDRNIAPNNTFSVTGSSHTGLENPADPNSKALESVFEDLTAYKNRNGGIWGRGEMHVFRNVKLADNAIGFTHASGAFGRYAFTSQVVDSLFVGETENIGNPTTDAEKAYGRSLPKPELPDFPIRGYEYYDFRHDVVNTTFRNYEDNATRKTGAISYLLFTSFGVSTNNAFERVKFVNAKPVYFPPMANNSKWASDNGGSTAYKTAAFRDKDGSLGGGPNSYVLIHDGVNDSIAVDAQACEIKPTWNAAVCKGDVGRLSFGRRPAAVDSAALVAQVPEEPAVPVRARLVLVRQPVLADLLLRLAVLVPARLAVLVQRPVPADPLLGSGGPGAFGGGAGGAPAQPPVVLSRNGKEYTVTAHQRTSRYRDQGDHRKAVPDPQPDGTGSRLLGDLPAAGIHHRSLGCAAGQPGCAAQGQRHLVLQGQGSAGVSTENAIEGAKFVNAKPVYFPPMERKWGNDNLNGVAWKASVIHDKDGSVGGVPNSYILLNDGVYDSIATDTTACEIKPTWNAAVCKGDIGRLSFGGPGGAPVGGGRGANLYGAAAPAGGAGPGAVGARRRTRCGGRSRRTRAWSGRSPWRIGCRCQSASAAAAGRSHP